MICAGYYYERRSTCAGDSGGPLQCPLPDGRWRIIGVTSWGFSECGSPLTVYARVDVVIEWIKSYVEGMYGVGQN